MVICVDVCMFRCLDFRLLGDVANFKIDSLQDGLNLPRSVDTGSNTGFAHSAKRKRMIGSDLPQSILDRQA